MEKRYTDAVVQPRALINENDTCVTLVNRNPLSGPCLFIADRGFNAFNTMAAISLKNQFFLFRLKDPDGQHSPFRHLIETSFLYLKHNLCLDTPHSIRCDFLRLEIFAKLIMYNFSSLLIFATGEPLQTGRYPSRLFFSSAIRIARLCIVLHRQPPDSEIIAAIQRHIYPVRTDKNRPRNMRSQRLNHLQNRA